jgi:hypothetical protein
MSEQAAKESSKSEADESFISAPFGDDLKLKESEFAIFQKLIEWQQSSEESPIVLGKPLS